MMTAAFAFLAALNMALFLALWLASDLPRRDNVVKNLPDKDQIRNLVQSLREVRMLALSFAVTIACALSLLPWFWDSWSSRSTIFFLTFAATAPLTVVAISHLAMRIEARRKHWFDLYSDEFQEIYKTLKGQRRRTRTLAELMSVGGPTDGNSRN